jgi:predicted CXXCH cytochrome family protein
MERIGCNGKARAVLFLWAALLLILLPTRARASEALTPTPPSDEEFAGTVHGKAGVTCGDCHMSRGKEAEGVSENTAVCITCHGDVAEVYLGSLHGKLGVAQCTDCHDPHRIRSYRELQVKERLAVCSRCHRDYLERHRWLPNTSLHFDYLECATCHSPRSEKSVVFFFARNARTGRVRLSYDQLVALYGGDPLGLKGQGSPDREIGRLFTLLRRRDENLVIDASIQVTKVFHDYSETHPKERQCVTCHSREARFYDSMFFILPGKGSAVYIPVKGTILASYPIGASVDFFLLGEDKLRKADIRSFLGLHIPREDRHPGFKLIDFLGLLLIVCTCAALCAHVVLRLLVKR